MCPEIPPHARIAPPSTRPARDTSVSLLPQVFWIALTLAMPVAGLVGWYFFGRDSFGAWAMDASEHWLMLGSAAVVLLLHIAMLVALFAEPKKDPGAKEKKSSSP
jgi:membrane protein YdbS with pleckstrin-like domain